MDYIVVDIEWFLFLHEQGISHTACSHIPQENNKIRCTYSNRTQSRVLVSYMDTISSIKNSNRLPMVRDRKM